MCRYVVRTYDAFRNAPAQVHVALAAALLFTLNRVSNIFIACKYILKSEYGFCLAAHESTNPLTGCVNQDNEYSLIHTQCAVLSHPKCIHVTTHTHEALAIIIAR